MNLLPSGPAPENSDTQEMVAYRQRFLDAGHFRPLEERVVEYATSRLSRLEGSPLVVDVGAGPGTYLARVLDASPRARGVAVDVSKFAARKAARVHPRARAIVADARGELPFAIGSADVALSVFAPRNPAALHRLLRPEGTLISVIPSPEHLSEVREALGMVHIHESKEDRLASLLEGRFALVERSTVLHRMVLAQGDLEALVGMGPSARHVSTEQAQQRIAALAPPVEVTAAFVVSVHVATPLGARAANG